MYGNQTTGEFCDLNDIFIYDDLPKEIRDLLKITKIDFCAESAIEWLKDHSIAETIEQIKKDDDEKDNITDE